MPAISCYCEKCGKNFFAKDEMYGPAKKNVFRSARKIEEPASWEEWLLHISSNCPDCRLSEIPEKCIADYQKLKGIRTL